MRALSCVGSSLSISAMIKPVPNFFSAKIAPSGEMIRECPYVCLWFGWVPTCAGANT